MVERKLTLLLHNTDQTYGGVAKFFHWIVAFSILFLCVLGIYMEQLPIGSAEEIDQKFWLYSLHKTIGILVFVVAVLRIIWAVVQPKPKPLAGGKPHEHWLAETVHWVLYGSLIVMPLSGWLHHAATRGFAPLWLGLPQGRSLVPESAQLASLFSWVHFIAAILLVIAIGMHIAGALKHFLLDQDKTLHRMLPFGEVGDGLVLSPQTGPGRSSFWAALLLFAGVLGIATNGHLQNSSQTTTTSGGLARSNGQSNWIVDHKSSTLGIEIVQSGNRTSGHFDKWTSAIQFNLDDLQNATVETIVDMGSLQLGSVSDQAKSADFLNAPQYPTARFTSNNFEALGDGKYIAHGQLELAGIEQKLALPFDLKIEGDQAKMTSSANIDRLDFGVGKKGFSDESTVGYLIEINIQLTAKRR